ncbi:hypothetical protein CF327_g4571 [Tilletia walkeri]|uniref:SAC domain-containing protein n=1 Tax=Tilletia walkeri TaxID=117179 RepID=A0A8X7NC40_9BASI|nr:hypothetical protein CF327_g4571 [Tilletia walkeri]KAE8269769.1 hypothetical protein A4X09_0g2582 [Tilletia walkeri]
MKAFFAGKGQRKAGSSTSGSPNSASPIGPSVGIGSNSSSLAVPPFPSPLPHRLLSVFHTPQGILLLPRSASASATAGTEPMSKKAADGAKLNPTTAADQSRHRTSSGTALLGAGAGALLPWDRYSHPKPVSAIEAGEILKTRDQTITQNSDIVSYGVLGVLRLFTCSYVLLITGRTSAGNFLHPAYPVYRPNRIFALPLEPDLALGALNTEADRQRREAAQAALQAARDVPDHEKTIGEDDDEEDEDEDDDDVYTPSILTPDGRIREGALSRVPSISGRSIASSRPGLTSRIPSLDPVPPSARRTASYALKEGEQVPSEQGTETKQAKPVQQREDTEADADAAAAAAADLTPPSDSVARMSPFFGADDAKSDSPGSTPISADERYRLAVQAELEDKVVKETIRQYADRGEMYYAYDVDLTRSLSKKSTQVSGTGTSGQHTGLKNGKDDLKPFEEPNQTLPLWRRADRKFWHNEHMAREFVDAGLHGFVLVVLQGYFQSTTLPLPQAEALGRASIETAPDDVLNPSTSAMDSASEAAAAPQGEVEPPTLGAELFLISRRAKERVGLRYQRRGLNDQGDCANTVETEQVVLLTRRQVVYSPGKTFTSPLTEREHVGYRLATFTQMRGSVPLFWSQSPFSLRPPIVMERSERDNAVACKRHFEMLTERYGHVTCINLAEQHGREGTLTGSFRLHVNAIEGIKEDESKAGNAEAELSPAAAAAKAADPHASPKLDSEGIWNAVTALGNPLPVHYYAFDFHNMCKGMKFENVKFLIAEMNERLGSMGWFERAVASDEGWAEKDAVLGASFDATNKGTAAKDASQGSGVQRTQDGIFRVNCIDCLDRTNVVQSALARHMLTSQLEHFGVIPSASKADTAEVAGDAAAAVALSEGSGQDSEEKGAPTDAIKVRIAGASTSSTAAAVPDLRQVEFEYAYNNLWANNGDMISQIYAGTRALKGDFTRTGKRNMIGAFNDATNSIFRLALGAVTDFWRQTVIDFNYGLIGLSALERYNEVLNAQDPAETYRLARVRTHAIEMCAEVVLKEGEERIGGWTLFSPVEPNRIQAVKFEEKVLLLTKKALYVCAFDFTAEKLQEFTRIRLGDITGVKKGLYLIAPNEGYHPDDHWGFVVSYHPAGEEIRLNNASMRNIPPPNAPSSTPAPTTNFVAFRAIRNELNSFGSSISAVGGGAGTATGSTASALEGTASNAPEGREQEEAGMNSHEMVTHIVELIVERCEDAGAVPESGEEGSEAKFVTEETIQSLAQAKAQAGMFAPLIEGLKRRLWL